MYRRCFEPLFNQFEPLARDHSGAGDELEKVVARTGTDIPPDRMFLMKASEKSNGLNAYVTGIGATKRFVVWDTTDRPHAGRRDRMFIFGHESGHYVLNHIPKMLAVGRWGCFLFSGRARVAEWLVRRFGARWDSERVGSRPRWICLC